MLHIGGTLYTLGKNFVIDHKNFSAPDGNVIYQGMDIHFYIRPVLFKIISF